MLKCVAEQVLCMVQRLRVLPQKAGKIYRTAERFLINYPKYIDDAYRFDVMVFDLVDGLIEHEWIKCVLIGSMVVN